MIKLTMKSMVILALLVVAIVSILVIGFLSTHTQGSVVISRVPLDTQVYINGKLYEGSSASLANGTYAVRGVRDGFIENNQTVLIDDYNKAVIISLEPRSDDAKKWVTENKQLYLDQEAKMGAQNLESSQIMAKDNPIILSLPVNNYTYSVGYVRDSSDTSGKKIILTITADAGYRNAAIEAIYKLGYNPTDYTIRFYDYKNPFEGNNP